MQFDFIVYYGKLKGMQFDSIVSSYLIIMVDTLSIRYGFCFYASLNAMLVLALQELVSFVKQKMLVAQEVFLH